jgi:hypothetical protein
MTGVRDEFAEPVQDGEGNVTVIDPLDGTALPSVKVIVITEVVDIRLGEKEAVQLCRLPAK